MIFDAAVAHVEERPSSQKPQVQYRGQGTYGDIKRNGVGSSPARRIAGNVLPNLKCRTLTIGGSTRPGQTDNSSADLVNEAAIRSGKNEPQRDLATGGGRP